MSNSQLHLMVAAVWWQRQNAQYDVSPPDGALTHMIRAEWLTCRAAGSLLFALVWTRFSAL